VPYLSLWTQQKITELHGNNYGSIDSMMLQQQIRECLQLSSFCTDGQLWPWCFQRFKKGRINCLQFIPENSPILSPEP